jgi:putative membrane protein
MWWSDWWGGYGPAQWMFFGPLMMVLFLVACVSVAYLVMRPDRAYGGHAMEILKERYARGEIDQAEFEARRRLLEA